MKPGLHWLLGAAALAALVWGLNSYQGHLIAKGDAQGADRVQKAWDADTHQRNLATGQANAVRQRAAEKVADEQAQREAKTAAAAARTATTLRGLRAEIDRLQKRDRPYGDGEPGLAACTREAAALRELFGESAAAYAELVQETAGLRDQVLGLQRWHTSVCPVPRAPASGGQQ